MSNFTPGASFIGGVLIGLASVALLLFQGRICGISGILGGTLRSGGKDRASRLSFVLGLVAGGFLLRTIYPQTMNFLPAAAFPALLVSGFLVGFGTSMGGGCTSGHGVCGLGRFSPRSLAATVLFMVSAMLTTYALHHLLRIPS